MIRRVCAAAATATAVAAGALLAVPAHADVVPDGWVWSDNGSSNTDSEQSGNNFGDVTSHNHGEDTSTNVNNVNGIATTATTGGIAVTYIFD
ncbi:hypothetical protein MF672_038345 [Actinomadura sp. ATCC 31491]|uniref:Uncharacterized protein n=1 Tax=Actinomadura luzonensis TaxID=2805427 RepID=A0ABT0G685_9ACTN|nr:hypothetical protein [Actinomadura luzonensis]MCK2219613.1 hypothetical protein [Actinomadura luzonensis]